jgi:lipopolysaccharide biosynthesis regulator YciM
MENSLSIEFWLIILLFITVSLSTLYIYYERKRVRTREDTSYLEGLRYMADGEHRRAIEKFKESVRQDSDNLDAYIKIGVILRREGLYNNAIRIHKDLALRGNIPEEDKIEVRKNLALDYWHAKNYDKAETLLDELRQNKSLINWVTPYLLRIYEERREWQKAYELFEQSDMAGSPQGKMKLALYKVRDGERIAREKDERSARILYKEAIKLDKKCAEAYLHLGDSYWNEERANDAINAWTDLCHKVPEKADLAFDRLEKAHYEKGQFSKIEELYQNLLQENEENLRAILALSDIYRKKGEYNDALKLLQQVQKKDIDQDIVQAQIVRVLFDKSQFKESAKLAVELIERKFTEKNEPSST